MEPARTTGAPTTLSCCGRRRRGSRCCRWSSRPRIRSAARRRFRSAPRPSGTGGAPSWWPPCSRYGPGGQFWAEHGPGSADPVPERPLRIWQIWNEENFNFCTSKPSPAKYAQLLKPSYAAIKSVDPGSQVIIGGLLGDARRAHAAGGGVGAIRFLDRFYRVKGIKSYFDGVALHPYAKKASYIRPLGQGLRRVMAQHRDRGTPLYITEVGWSSDPGRSWARPPPARPSS